MWLKGNLHCHTTVSDGDSAPADVCHSYAARGYDFLAITDHSARVDPRRITCDGMLLVPSEEISIVSEDEPDAPLHVNGFGIKHRLTLDQGATKTETIQNCIDAVISDGGIAQINHPNFRYAFDHTDMAQTHGARLLEVYNGHPQVHNEGDEEHIGVERMWDHLLSSGMLLYGTAVDDSHHYTGEFAPHRANPFRGWIWVRARRRSVREVLLAISRGDFYASTGVELDDVTKEGSRLSLTIRPVPGVSYATRFVGDDGKLLAESGFLDPSFDLKSDSSLTYVRAKVISSDGACAWTQPVFTSRFGPA